jgi:putative flippase GtrA
MMRASQLCMRFGRFSLIGLSGAVLQVILFNLLIESFHLPGVAAMPIAVETVLLNNFFWHERFTWRARGAAGLRPRLARLWRFHAANGMVSLAGNTVLAYWLVQQLKAPPWPSAVAAIAICAPINFLIADRWVYCQAEVPPGTRAVRSWQTDSLLKPIKRGISSSSVRCAGCALRSRSRTGCC